MVGLISLPTLVLAKSGGVLTRTPEISAVQNSQIMPVLVAYTNYNPTSIGGATIAIVDDTALSAASEEGSAFIDPGASGTGQINTYVVRQGDTIGEIAEMFGVSVNTIMWANNLSAKTLKVGQELVILPISGVKHTVKSGDTLATIAKKYKADTNDIIAYNGLAADSKLAVGDEIIIPDGVVTSVSNNSAISNNSNQTTSAGYYLRPIRGGVRSQGLHGYNGIDLASSVGTPIMASADGVVVIARTTGYNGGYGLYVAIKHSNGTQTVYGHMSRVDVAVGQTVEQGEVIGAVGNTGNSSGPHVHFEIRGAKNPF